LEKQEILNLINHRMAVWSTELELFSAANMHDLAISSEPIIGRLLNTIFGWHLRNLNEIHLNASGVDLFDDENKCLVQVTTTPLNSQKAKNTFSKIPKEFSGYRVIIFSLVNKTANWPKNNHTIKDDEGHEVARYDPKKNYLDFHILFAKLASSTTYGMDDLANVLDILNEITDSGEAQNNPLVLEQMIGQLSKSDIQVSRNLEKGTDVFEIQDKIDYNELTVITEYILEKDNAQLFDEIYSSFRQQGMQADDTIFELLCQIYWFNPDVQAAKTSVEKFGKVIQCVEEYLKKNGTGFTVDGHLLSNDDEKRFIAYIVVDAFNRCKIFEHPLNTKK